MNFKVLVICLVISACSGRKFTRCQLATALLKTNVIEKTFLGSWVCLIEKVSNRDTNVLKTSSGKKYYGLFQIPNRWCKEGRKGGECNITCESLLDDDIRDDAACAVLIFHKEGFKYWTQWVKRCKNDNLITTEIYKCPDLNSPRSSPTRFLNDKTYMTSSTNWWQRIGIYGMQLLE